MGKRVKQVKGMQNQISERFVLVFSFIKNQVFDLGIKHIVAQKGYPRLIAIKHQDNAEHSLSETPRLEI